jgi:E3 ubiquitin-protein ligase SlrP
MGGAISLGKDIAQALKGVAPKEEAPMRLARKRIANLGPTDTVLDLSYLGLRELPPLPDRLIELNCGWNATLSTLPTKLPENLRLLNCSHSRLTRLPDTLPSDLEKLVCHNNLLTHLPETLPASLVSLDCEFNRLTCLPEILPADLEILKCSENRLTCLPETLPEKLRVLYCYENQLNALPNVLPVKLRSLMCYNNPLGRLPERLPDNLHLLNCSSTLLRELPSVKPASLSFLRCSSNKLTTLPDWVSELQGLRCDGNPLACQQFGCGDTNVSLLEIIEEESNPAGYLLRLRLAETELSRGRIVSRCYAIKEELMATAWAPARVERWLDAGVDVDAM